MSRSIIARVKAGPGEWQRFAGSTELVTATGFPAATVLEWDDGTGVIREVTTEAAGLAPSPIPNPNFAVLQDGTIRLYAAAPASATDVEYQIGAGAWASIGATAAGDYSTAAVLGNAIRLRAVNGAGESAATTARTVGDQIFYAPASAANLTSRWVSATPTYDAGPPPHITMPALGAGLTERRFISVDEAGGLSLASVAADLEVYAEYVFTTATEASAGIVIRGAGAAPTETGVVFRDQWISTGWTNDILYYDAGGSVGFSTTGLGGNDATPPTVGVPYCLRASASGGTFAYRRWLKSAGEPGSPDISGTYAPNPVSGAGRVGLFGFRATTAQYRCLGIGLNGAPAPRPLT